LGVTGDQTGEGAAALAHITGVCVVTEMITVAVVAAAAVATTTMVAVVVTVMTTMVAVVGAGVEAAGMKGTMMEGGAGMVAAPLPGVQEAPSGRAARSGGLRLSSGTVRGRKSKGEQPPFKAGKGRH